MKWNSALPSQNKGGSSFGPLGTASARVSESRHHKILAAISNPQTTAGLISLAARLCRAGDAVVALRVVPVAQSASLETAQREAALTRRFRDLMLLAARTGGEAGARVETVLQVADDVATGIVKVANSRPDTRLLLLGWPSPARHSVVGADICRKVIRESNCDVAVFLNRGLGDVQRVVVPVGGGPHARLGLLLAADLVDGRTADLVVLHVVGEETTDTMSEQAIVEGLVRDEMRDTAGGLTVVPRVTRSNSVVKGILDEIDLGCDLLVVGTSEEGLLRLWLSGSIPATIAARAPCSVLLVHKCERSSGSWMRRMAQRILGSGSHTKRNANAR